MNEWQEPCDYLLDRQGYPLFDYIWDEFDDGEEMWPLLELNNPAIK